MIGMGPHQIRRVVAGHSLAIRPFGLKIDDRIVITGAVLSPHQIDNGQDVDDPDRDSRLLPDFAPARLFHGFTGLLPASGKAPASLARRMTAPDQKKPVVFPDDGANADDRAGREGLCHGKTGYPNEGRLNDFTKLTLSEGGIALSEGG